MAAPTPAEVAFNLQQGLDRVNAKVTELNAYDNLMKTRAKSYRKHGLWIDRVRANTDGTLSKWSHKDQDSGVWQALDNGADAVTPFFLVSATNGRESPIVVNYLSSAFNRKAGVTNMDVVIDMVYAGTGGMPDPAFPGDTSKTVPITQAYLLAIHKDGKGHTINTVRNDIHFVNTYQWRGNHPCPDYAVAQGVWARLRVVSTEDGVNPMPIKDVLNPSGLVILDFDEVGHFSGL